MTSKVKFRIISCSGEDKDNPVTELLTTSPQSKGWQSPRFCDYPQEINFQFTNPIRLKQIQFLSHQSKISSKIEIFVFMPDPNAPHHNIEFKYKKLGFLSLDSNERSGYQARELKSVYLDHPALYMKLVIHKCHMNKYNLFNQVGLIALSVYGDALDPQVISEEASSKQGFI
jgi:centrosomal protein CEP104